MSTALLCGYGSRGGGGQQTGGPVRADNLQGGGGVHDCGHQTQTTMEELLVRVGELDEAHAAMGGT